MFSDSFGRWGRHLIGQRKNRKETQMDKRHGQEITKWPCLFLTSKESGEFGVFGAFRLTLDVLLKVLLESNASHWAQRRDTLSEIIQ